MENGANNKGKDEERILLINRPFKSQERSYAIGINIIWLCFVLVFNVIWKILNNVKLLFFYFSALFIWKNCLKATYYVRTRASASGSTSQKWCQTFFLANKLALCWNFCWNGSNVFLSWMCLNINHSKIFCSDVKDKSTLIILTVIYNNFFL